MNFLVEYWRRYRSRQHVRPWALATPILVLLLALPMLRPLRKPEAPSNNELSRLAAIEAMAENSTQAIDNTESFATLRMRAAGDRLHPPDTARILGKYYSDKPPVLAALLAQAYRVMKWFGLTFRAKGPLVVYLLTMIGATIPVAAAAGLVYKMARLFELPRTLRCALSAIVVLGSGLISYAVVLNSQAPAAALVLASCACIIHLIASTRTVRTQIGTAIHFCFWMALSGLCAAMAAVIDLGAGFFLLGIIFVILAIRWPMSQKIGAVVLYALGAAGPMLLHVILTVSVTGDWRPPFLHDELYASSAQPTVYVNPTGATAFLHDERYTSSAQPSSADHDWEDTESDATAPAWMAATGAILFKGLSALFGSRGMLSHFPVLIVGVCGLYRVLRQNWPPITKMLAAVTLLGGAAVVTTYIVMHANWAQAMFGPRWFIIFLPLVLFWSGAFLRHRHWAATWSAAGLLLAFSIGVSLLGMADPFVAAPPGRYTAAPSNPGREQVVKRI